MDIDLVLAALNKLTTSTPPVLLFCGLLGIGYLWKAVPIIPNKRIPMINLIVAIVIYPVIARADMNETYSMRFPWVGAMVRDEIVAVCIFSVSWLTHRVAFKWWLDKRLPQRITETGDTKFFQKEPLTPPPDSGTKPE